MPSNDYKIILGEHLKERFIRKFYPAITQSRIWPRAVIQPDGKATFLLASVLYIPESKYKWMLENFPEIKSEQMYLEMHDGELL